MYCIVLKYPVFAELKYNVSCINSSLGTLQSIHLIQLHRGITITKMIGPTSTFFALNHYPRFIFHSKLKQRFS